jgi:hypothetical protein
VSGTVSDRSQLDSTIGPDGMQRNYLVLSDEERAKGFVRPVRRSYEHVGIAGPKYQLRDLDESEIASGLNTEFAKFEPYPPLPDPKPMGYSIGKYWSQRDLDRVGKGCGTVTTMGNAIAETYARSPGFYSGTFCCGCGTHLPVGRDGEFVWDGTDERVGT